jgi:outer membrane protein assembly factor BamB
LWSAWPLVNHDPAGTRRSPSVGPRAPVERFEVAVPASALVIGVDGTLYTTVHGDGSRLDTVEARDPATGELRWSFRASPSVPTTVPPFSPAIAAGPEGNVYVAFQQGPFYALNPDGSVRWQYTTGRTGPSGDLSVFGPPLVDFDGRVYVGERSVVHAFGSDGELVWRFDARSVYAAAPAARSAFTPPAPPDDHLYLSPPIVDGDGTIYVVANGSDSNFQTTTRATVFAIDRSDRTLWSLTFPRASGAS